MGLFAMARVGFLIGALAGCSAAQTSTAITAVNTTLSTAQTDLTEAINFYAIVKGTAQVAVTADPSLGSRVTPVITSLDAILKIAQVALTDAASTAPALEALAKQLQSQSASLLSTAAPAIKVVSGH